MTRRRKRLSRAAKVRLSIGATLVGTLVLTGLAVWIESSRETDLGDEREGVTNRLAHFVPEGAPQLAFVDVAPEAGLLFRHGRGARTRRLTEDTGSGLAWGDYDGDGDPDLYVVDLATPEALGNRLFRNDGGAFTDVTDAAGVGDREGNGMGASFADVDGDGALDLYVTNDGPNRLYLNRGDGTFEEAAARAGVDDPRWSVGATWGDYDRDGHLDLYVVNYVEYEDLPASMSPLETTSRYVAPPALNPKAFDAQPNELFRNRGDGTFEPVAVECGVADPRGRGLAATFCDLDGDGWLDLYVNNDVSPNALFVNRGGAPDGTRFIDWSTQSGTADPRGSMGLSVGDVCGLDGGPDGLPDLFITHWVTQQNALYEGLIGKTGKLLYRDRARQLRLGQVSTARVGWGAAFTDFDLDGRADIVVLNGSTLERKEDQTLLVAEKPFLFWNDGKRFHDLAPAAGAAGSLPVVGRGLAAADYDGDGDVDFATQENRGPLRLLRNDSERRGQSLRVRLVAPDALRFGARVRLVAGDVRATRWYGSDVSYASQHEGALTFGLGDRDRAASLEVTWANGTTTERTDVPAGSVEVAP
jgi:enediyne biosynthesis protein E4